MANHRHPESTVVHIGVGQDPSYGALSTPIYQTVTYQHPGSGLGPFDYSRTVNPTRLGLAHGLADLEQGAGATLFSSGMAAITALCHLLDQKSHVVLTEDVYGGTYRLMVDVFQRFGVQFTFVDTRDVEKVAAAMQPNTRLVFVETPSNPLLQITDLRSMVEIAHGHGAWLAVDNTFMTPLRQRPLALGADFSVYSVTKYLSGHNDVLAGAIVTPSHEMAIRLDELANATGGVLAPFDAWLVMRGVKTLAARLDRQERTAQIVAERLSAHPRVSHVFYPGLPKAPGRTLHFEQATGAGAMLSFQLPDPQSIPRFMDALQLVSPAVSLGGVESLITHPFSETHREFPESERLRLNILPGLLRLSVGLEYPDDIVQDLIQALDHV